MITRDIPAKVTIVLENHDGTGITVECSNMEAFFLEVEGGTVLMGMSRGDYARLATVVRMKHPGATSGAPLEPPRSSAYPQVGPASPEAPEAAQ